MYEKQVNWKTEQTSLIHFGAETGQTIYRRKPNVIPLVWEEPSKSWTRSMLCWVSNTAEEGCCVGFWQVGVSDNGSWLYLQPIVQIVACEHSPPRPSNSFQWYTIVVSVQLDPWMDVHPLAYMLNVDNASDCSYLLLFTLPSFSSIDNTNSRHCQITATRLIRRWREASDKYGRLLKCWDCVRLWTVMTSLEQFRSMKTSVCALVQMWQICIFPN